MNLVNNNNHWRIFLTICLVSLITLTGCQATSDSAVSGGNNSEDIESPIADVTEENQSTDIDNNIMSLPTLEGKAIVEMKVKGQSITIELDGNNAPITAGNFLDLVDKGVYDGLVFHRVVTDPQPFVAQGGDPQGKDPNFPVSRLGTGGYTDPNTNSQRYIPLEIRPEYDESAEDVTAPEIIYSTTTTMTPQLRHEYGVIAMARSQMPDSASSQFYFTLADLPFLDGNYAVFGKVTDGMDVVEGIAQGDRIESVEVISGIENLKR
ncbi:peptidylprolyl isomerase [Cyanobacterium stanieri LEGE 03274]|uniref:Peptidyl-prolyl cis-trans isomerase n=1 Tax=Cyanobacterium stanieri LEGE 03274 TaxID=1828756 RepID=A0ABR9V355_9CHRO|nr:peptidylprolyl isomerase [Cyanobacterium stanieri]MBE9222326.1 peptidylprolyl isomerase [Cyanobacterium stanieri LEGE 03274]